MELSAAWRYRDTGRIYARYERGYTVPDGLMIADQAVVNGDRVYKITNAEDEKYDMYEIGLRDKVAFSTVSVSLWMSNTNNQLYRMYVRGLSDARTLNLASDAPVGGWTSASADDRQADAYRIVFMA